MELLLEGGFEWTNNVHCTQIHEKLSTFLMNTKLLY